MDANKTDRVRELECVIADLRAESAAARAAAPSVSAPTDEQQAFNAAYAKVLGHPVQAWELETAWRMMVGDMWRAARAAAPVSGQGATLPPPYGWLQYIDGSKTQNFARDEEELAQVKDIFRVMKHPGKAEYPGVYSEDQMLAALAHGQAHGQLCIDRRPRSEDSRAKALEAALSAITAIYETHKHLCDDTGGSFFAHASQIAAEALASTTSQKADNE